MQGWKSHRVIEWGCIIFLLMICVTLTSLQSRWTSSVGRAATKQQAVQIRSQAESLCNAFDTQLNEACTLLRPRADEIETLGYQQAHVQCLRRWQVGNPRPMFLRLAVVVPEAGRAQLYLLDQKTAKLSRAEWPPEWEVLHQNLSQRTAARMPQPFEDPTGLLREYPVFGHRGEIEWTIMELDQTYLRQAWLPELARTCFNPGETIIDDIAVKTTAAVPGVIFSTGSRAVPENHNVVSLAFNTKAVDGRDEPDKAWTLYAWPRAGELATVVSRARTRDFVLACILDVFLLIGGLLLIHYARRARRLGDARMQFVAAVSHELRTPLTVIRAAAHNLRRGIVHDPARVDKYANFIIEHSDQLTDMVEQVLAFAGARRNESTLARKPVIVAQVLQESIAACASDMKNAACEVHIIAGPELPPVLGDARALRRVFQNLLTNAAKHGGDGKWIGVSARHVDGVLPAHVEVEISDHGAGIAERERARIFEPFFRGSRAQTQQTRGSGIGLSVVREIVEAHHGSVRVESGPGKGATFTVLLPVADEAPDASPEES